MALGDIWIVRLQLLKKSQLIQALQAQLPILLVVNLAFFEGQLAANHFVASGGVPLELNSADRKLLAFIDVNVERHQLFLLVEAGRRNRGEIDVPLSTVRVLQVLQALGNFLAIEDVAIFKRENGAQGLAVSDGLV